MASRCANQASEGEQRKWNWGSTAERATMGWLNVGSLIWGLIHIGKGQTK
jgi:hypothetical protein